MHRESSPISVSSTHVLPDTTEAQYIPLGGDGFAAPHFCWAVGPIFLAGDASGGNAEISVTMDDRYCSLITYMNHGLAGPTNTEILQVVQSADGSNRIPLIGFTGNLIARNSVLGSTNSLLDYIPPPTILPGGDQVAVSRTIFVNDAAMTFQVSMNIFCFDIRARELTPMAGLLWSKGST